MDIRKQIQRRSQHVFTVFVDMKAEILEAALEELIQLSGTNPIITCVITHYTDNKALMATVTVIPTIDPEKFPIRSSR